MTTMTPLRTVSHYALEERLGAGGMGIVYRATDVRLGRRVALKFLRPLAGADAVMRDRFIEEARAASSLDHPNVCTIFEVDETPDGEIFIAMPCYEGETLERLIAHGPLEIERAISLAVQIGRGLGAAHEELIIHRDIKPGNIMITRGDTVKILDFGLAKLIRVRDAGGKTITGTPAYMSPEQLRGEPVDQRTDIWGLGAVLYEMVAGVAAFRGEHIDEIIEKVLHKQPRALSEVCPAASVALDRIVEKALARNLRERYERVETLISDLADLKADTDSGAVTIRRAPVAATSSLAVLPFVDMSAGGDQRHLCDGIAEEILRALSVTPELHVVSRTSAFQFRQGAGDIREIGAKLGVSTVLEGSVRRAGKRVRISAQLINVDDGYRLWYERYDREMKDLFAIEDEIAEQIARALRVTLVERRDPTTRDAALSGEAYELYLQGRHFFQQHRRKALEIAIQTFSEAIRLQPDYARAWAGIADCHAFLRLYLGHGDEAIDAADEASRKALELDPELPEAHASRGLALFLRGRFDEAESELKRAIELNPRLYDPHYIFGRVCFTQGRPEDAATHFREACSIVPEAYDSWYLLGMCWRRSGNESKAHAADLECIEAVKKVVRQHPEDTRAWTMGAAVLAELGEPDRAADWVGRALAVDRDEPIIQYNAACVYVRLGRFDEALDSLQVASGEHGVSKAWIAHDPDLDPLRSDPRFSEYLEQSRG